MDVSLEVLQQRIERSCEFISNFFFNVGRRQSQPGKPFRVIAVLIWLLSNNVFLAICFLQRYPNLYDFVEAYQADSQRAVLTFLQWLQDDDTYRTVLEGIASIEHPMRRQADVFLMESLLVQLLIWQNQRGLTVDLPQAANTYFRLWTHRPIAARTRRWLHRLAWHRNTRRHWGVLLRRNWILTLTVLPLDREMSREDIRDRVFIWQEI